MFLFRDNWIGTWFWKNCYLQMSGYLSYLLVIKQTYYNVGKGNSGLRIKSISVPGFHIWLARHWMKHVPKAQSSLSSSLFYLSWEQVKRNKKWPLLKCADVNSWLTEEFCELKSTDFQVATLEKQCFRVSIASTK